MIDPVWFIAFGIAWLVLVVGLFVGVLIVELRADDREDDDLDHVGEWTSR